MAVNDVTVLSAGGLNLPSAWTFKTEANTTAPAVGEPVKIGGTGGNYVLLLATGDPEIGTDVVAGIAASTGTQTASADGVCSVLLVSPGMIFRCKAASPANIDTAAKLLAILNDKVAFDLDTGVFTVDENEGDDTAHGLRIVGGDIITGDIYFMVRQSGTITD